MITQIHAVDLGAPCGAVDVPVQGRSCTRPLGGMIPELGDFRGRPTSFGKSVNAFLFSMDTLWELSGGNLWFWTFTFHEAQSDSAACESWARFMDAVRCSLFRGVRGLRVFQLHRSHGVHVHFVVDRRIAFWRVAKIAYRYGFGRIDVARVRGVRRGGSWRLPGYLARDMGKACRERRRFLGARRLWGAFGPWRDSRTRVRDVRVEGPSVRLARASGLAGVLTYRGWCELSGFALFGESAAEMPFCVLVRFSAWVLVQRTGPSARNERRGQCAPPCYSLNNSDEPF